MPYRRPTLWDAHGVGATNNLDRAQVDRKGFSRRLQTKGFKKDRVGKNRKWTWFGIGLRSTSGSYYSEH
jgi:hypothetical protein